MTFDEVAAKLENLQPFIQYLVETDESEWQVDVVRNKDNTKNCLFGHLVNFIDGKDYQGTISSAWDCFEAFWSTSWAVYPINDGRNPEYQQATPKQRCIAYVKDLWLAQATPTWRQMEIDHEAWLRERESAA